MCHFNIYPLLPYPRRNTGELIKCGLYSENGYLVLSLKHLNGRTNAEAEAPIIWPPDVKS